MSCVVRYSQIAAELIDKQEETTLPELPAQLVETHTEATPLRYHIHPMFQFGFIYGLCHHNSFDGGLDVAACIVAEPGASDIWTQIVDEVIPHQVGKVFTRSEEDTAELAVKGIFDPQSKSASQVSIHGHVLKVFPHKVVTLHVQSEKDDRVTLTFSSLLVNSTKDLEAWIFIYGVQSEEALPRVCIPLSLLFLLLSGWVEMFVELI